MNGYIHIGVDPGLNGAVAVQSVSATTVFDMPTREVTRNGKKRRLVDCVALGGVLKQHITGPTRAFVEHVGAMPGQGVTSMFSFGRAVGSVDGSLGAFDIEPLYIVPAVWTRAVGLLPGASKDAHRALAAKLFPSLAGQLSRKKDEGRADALLLLHYALTTFGAKP